MVELLGASLTILVMLVDKHRPQNELKQPVEVNRAVFSLALATLLSLIFTAGVFIVFLFVVVQEWLLDVGLLRDGAARSVIGFVFLLLLWDVLNRLMLVRLGYVHLWKEPFAHESHGAAK